MRPFTFPTSLGGHDMAVDLGTANTVVYALGSGIVVSEPSVVAVDCRTGDLQAVGTEVWQILGREEICAIRPLRGGVIADLKVTEGLLRYFIHKVHRHRWAHPRVVASVPSGVSAVEKRAVAEACLSAGAREAYLIEKPIAAAIGAGLPVEQPTGSMVLDLGAGTSEVAVISMGGIVASRSLRVGGQDLDQAIINHLKRRYKLLIGQQTAEQIKLEIGSASPQKQAETEIRGRDIASEQLKTVLLTSEEIRWVLEKTLSRIIESVKQTLERTPPELACDVMDRGIMLAGGSALIRGLIERLRHETGMPACVAESPCTCVAIGSGRALEQLAEVPRWRSSAGREALSSSAAFKWAGAAAKSSSPAAR